ncbi:MAG: phosphatase PAP2 family protein [Bacteroidetes bacterium]|nr:phosphatase PAP2 family protein [Bacteroidota bacterium]
MKRLFLVLAFCGLCLPAAHAQPGPRRFLDWTIHDAKDWATSWSGERALKVGLTVGVLIPMSLVDEDILEKQRTTETPSGEFLEFANYLGGPEAKYVALGTFGATLLTRSRRLQDASFTSLQSVAYAYTIGSVSKRVLVGRSRPYQEKGAFDFHPFSNNNTSFPSGHATTAWALVMPWIVYYPNPLTFGLGVLATGTAISRLKRQQHWVTDVIAGSFLGGSMGYWLARKHQGRLPRFAQDVRANLGPTGFEVSWTMDSVR